jgi:ABC-type multidrug transport system ATPase subunit
LLRNLHRLAGTRTIFIISHRLAPVLISDSVAMLADGEIVAVGPPSDIAQMTRTHMANRGPADRAPRETDLEERIRHVFAPESRNERRA